MFDKNYVLNIVDANYEALSEGRDWEVVYFEFNGAKIYDPFLDITGFVDVDPVAYYGSAFLNSKFVVALEVAA